MKNKTTKVITIETWRKTIVRKHAPTIFARCDTCGIDTQMFAPEEFAHLQDTTERIIYRRIENGDFHFTEIENGALLVCGNSLKQIQKCLPQTGEQK